MADIQLFSRGPGRYARRRRRLRLLAAVALVAVAAASALLASGSLHPATRHGATLVAIGDDAPVVRVAPALRHTLPTPPPAGPPVSASNGCISLPILYYHYIRVDSNPNDHLGFQLSVTPQHFQAQMDWLRAAGAHPVTLAQMMAALQGGPPLPSRPVVLTFDDGHDDFATRAVPVLLRDHFVATTFVVPGFLNTASYMTPQQVQQVASDGMVVGAHTVHHVDLTKVPASAAHTEITQSKALLEQLIGQPVLDFAYPFGAVNASVVAMVGQAGFRDAVATTWGTQQCITNRFQLHRLEILGSDSLASFAGSAGVPAPPPNWTDPASPPD